MKILIFTVWISLLVLLAGAQTISKMDAPDFRGTVRMHSDSAGGKNVAPKFEAVKVGRKAVQKSDPAYLDGDLPISDSVRLVGTPYGFRSTSDTRYCIRNPAKREFLIILHELSGMESCYDVLSFWKDMGDSVKFIRFYPKTFMVNFGGIEFEDSFLKNQELKYFLLRGSGGETGGIIGSLMLIELSRQARLQTVETWPFGMNSTNETRLKGLIIKQGNKILVELTRKDYSLSGKMEKVSIEYYEVPKGKP